MHEPVLAAISENIIKTRLDRHIGLFHMGDVPASAVNVKGRPMISSILYHFSPCLKTNGHLINQSDITPNYFFLNADSLSVGIPFRYFL